MKAVVSTKYGSPDVLQFKEVERPTPKDNEVLVKVYATSVNAVDWHILSGKPFLTRLMGGGLLRPKREIPGSDVAGRVEAVGSRVKEFQLGDEVFGGAHGSFAEYACAHEELLVLKPANLSYEEAAAVPIAAITALQALRDQGRVQVGQTVLITGASGGVGSFAVQIARSFGAQVTGVCSTRNSELTRSIGADHVIDYTREDFTRMERRYDLVVATAGYHSIFGYRRVLNPNGIFVFVGGLRPMRSILQFAVLGPLISRFGKKKTRFFFAKRNKKDLFFLKELLEAGKIRPIIDRSYPLSQAAEALRYHEEGHARGKVVVTVSQ